MSDPKSGPGNGSSGPTDKTQLAGELVVKPRPAAATPAQPVVSSPTDRTVHLRPPGREPTPLVNPPAHTPLPTGGTGQSMTPSPSPSIGGGEGDLPATSWRIAPAPGAALLARAERWIRARLPVAGPDELRRLAAGAAREAEPELRGLLSDALEHGARLLEAIEAPAVRIDGAEQIAKQPEFQSVARLRVLVSILAERERLTRVLEPTAGSPRVRISIGRENGGGAIGACSVVATGVTVGGRSGSIGVLGPLRMPYPRLVSLVTYVSRRLAERP